MSQIHLNAKNKSLATCHRYLKQVVLNPFGAVKQTILTHSYVIYCHLRLGIDTWLSTTRQSGYCLVLYCISKVP